MIRLPDSDAVWEEHTHTSGRKFLSNTATNETRWLWQKWDMKGRLFVRNIANPTHQVWVDHMDLSMRLQSGTASQDEVARYIADNQPPPPPPPPPQQPPQHPHPQHPHPHHPHWAHQHHQPANPPPEYNHPEHPYAPPAHHPFPHNPPPYHQDVNAHSHRRNPDPYLANRTTDNPHFRRHHSYRDDNHPAFDNRNPYPQPPYPPHTHTQNHNHPNHQPSFFPLHHDSHPLHPDPYTHDNPSTEHPHHPKQRHTNLLNHHSNQNFSQNQQNSDIRKDHHAKTKKRPFEFEHQTNAHGRYWTADHKPGKKRSRNGANSENPSKSSRFAPIPDTLRPRSPRPAPLPPEPKPLSGDIYGSFKPSTRAAQLILSNSVVPHAPTVGLLHDRDFKITNPDSPSSPSSVYILTNGGDEEYSFEAVVGTCEQIEKDYLRLTSAPRPEAVRPPHVLVNAVSHIKSRWRDGAAEYDWVCRQLKSVRQDYKVQHVKDRHVVDVYETHARIALENNDLGEFNTCVAQVQELYRTLNCPQRVQDEFACYRILYNVLVRASQWEQAQILAKLTAAQRSRRATRFALSVRSAVAAGNYRHYFKLCSDQPPKTMVSYLLVHLHDRVRFRAATVMTASYGPGQPGTVPLRFVLKQMGWTENDQPRELMKSVHPEKVVPEDDKEVLQGLRSLTPLRQPLWVIEALAFILGMNMACTSDPESEAAFIDRVRIDFKATKAQGLRERKTVGKLITHAGSEDVKLMK